MGYTSLTCVCVCDEKNPSIYNTQHTSVCAKKKEREKTNDVYMTYRKRQIVLFKLDVVNHVTAVIKFYTKLKVCLLGNRFRFHFNSSSLSI